MLADSFDCRTDPVLRRQALLDLAQRSDGGIAIHPALWLLACGLNGAFTEHALFSWIGVAAFTVIACMRLWLRRGFGARVARDTVAARRLFLVLLLASPLVWGLAAGMTYALPGHEALQNPFCFIVTGVAASGCMALSIDRFVRFAYPLITLLPPVAMLLASGSDATGYRPAAFAFFLAYMTYASASVERDYWKALHLQASLEERSRQLEAISLTDALTQVPNRRGFERLLAEAWLRAEQAEKPLTVMMVDIDHFKRINDAHGHPFGDRCLQAVAAALQGALRHPGDRMARYGGEEFAVLLPDTAADGAGPVAERLLSAVGAVRLRQKGVDVPLTCSIGVASILPAPGDTAQHAVDAADAALYVAKATGRNRQVAAPTERLEARAA